jgi:hypothetical protein
MYRVPLSIPTREEKATMLAVESSPAGKNVTQAHRQEYHAKLG